MTQRNRDSGLRLVGRVYGPRIAGLGFAFIAVSVFLYQRDASIAAWIILVSWSLVWPHVAHFWPRHSSDPARAEIINLYIDAFMIGFFVPLMAFNTVPSVGLLYMHLLSIISVLGLRACLLGALAEAAGIGVSVLLFGFDFAPESTQLHQLISIPMLVFYPLFVGFNAYWLSVKLSTKQDVLRVLSQTDGLTGLYNRMHWEEQVAREFARVRRGGPMASLIFIDVDWFKRINDSHGHLIGDEVLRTLARSVQECARDTDVCGRYGGEEFGVLLIGSGLEAAHAIAERLRLKVNEQSLHPGLEIRTTISLGVAEINNNDENYSQWLDRADRALYLAKQQGRNTTVCA